VSNIPTSLPRATPAHSGRGRPREGMILFVVVLFVMILSLAGLSFVANLSTEHKAVQLRGDELQAEAIAGSGVEWIKTLLEGPPEALRQSAGREQSGDLFRGVLVLDEQGTGRKGRFSIISPRIDGGQITGIRFGLANESARLNLAVLPQWDQQQPGAARQALLNLPQMTDSIADAILDWIDRDTTPRQFGAESEYYAGLGVPYGPRNAEPTSLEELLLVRDVTRELLFGPDENFNYTIDAQEQQGATAAPATAAGSGALPWSSLLTVYSAEKNVDPEGKKRIDLNDKDLSALHQRLSRRFDPDVAKFVIMCRQYPRIAMQDARRGPHSPAVSEGKNQVTPIGDHQLDFSLPGRYRLASILDVVGVAVQLPAAVDPNQPIFESPLPGDTAALGETLPKLLDYTTTDRREIIVGRVNVNEAPPTVLLGVPGIDEQLAERIVAGRTTADGRNDPARRHPTWLLTEGLVKLEKMKSLVPYLTCGGQVYRAQIVGFFDRAGPIVRAEVVVDATASPPRQVYYKDLRLLGHGYSRETLGGAAVSGNTPFSTAGQTPRL